MYGRIRELERLQWEMLDFKVTNVAVHFEEAGPHMHVAGVPAGRGFVQTTIEYGDKKIETRLEDDIVTAAEYECTETTFFNWCFMYHLIVFFL